MGRKATIDYAALVGAIVTKINYARRDQGTSVPDPLGKCVNPATGEPVSARRQDEALLPAPGTVEPSEDGNGTGRCPVCATTVKLSSKGFVTAHTVRRENIPQPPPTVRLMERQTAVTDAGARVGSPDASERAVSASLSGHAYRGWHVPMALPENPESGPTVRIVVRKADGKGTQTITVPATEANVRTALRQEQRKKQRTSKKTGELIGGPDAALLTRYGRMLKGLTGLEAVGVLGAEPGTYMTREAFTVDAVHAPEGREERAREGRSGHVPTSPGPAMFKGPAMSSVPPAESARVTGKGKPRNAIGWGGPLGRERMDRVAVSGNTEACQGRDCTLEGCPAVIGGRHGWMQCHVYRGLSKTRQRRYWQQVKVNRDRDRQAREYAARERACPGGGYVSRETVSRAGVQRV